LFLKEKDKKRKLVSENLEKDGKLKRIYENGLEEYEFPEKAKRLNFQNGYSVVNFINGDVKQILPDKTIIYFYKEYNIT